MEKIPQPENNLEKINELIEILNNSPGKFQAQLPRKAWEQLGHHAAGFHETELPGRNIKLPKELFIYHDLWPRVYNLRGEFGYKIEKIKNKTEEYCLGIAAESNNYDPRGGTFSIYFIVSKSVAVELESLLPKLSPEEWRNFLEKIEPDILKSPEAEFSLITPKVVRKL